MKPLITYKYAQACLSGKRKYVAYYVYNPFNKRMMRKKIDVTNIPASKLRSYANKLVNNINKRLEADWNPFIEENKKAFTSITVAIDFVINKKLTYIRSSSAVNYRSRCEIFKKWLIENKYENIPVIEFDKSKALEFMNYSSEYTNIFFISNNHLFV